MVGAAAEQRYAQRHQGRQPEDRRRFWDRGQRTVTIVGEPPGLVAAGGAAAGIELIGVERDRGDGEPAAGTGRAPPIH